MAMPDPNRLLVVTHPVLGAITPKEIEGAIPKAERRGGWELVEIKPIDAKLGELHEIDWAAALAEQERQIAERLAGKLSGRQRLAYFGFAPIPLAFHLGYRIEHTSNIAVYQRHHERKDWSWVPSNAVTSRPTVKPLNIPTRGSRSPGPAVIRISTSYPVDPAATAEVIPMSLAEVDVALVAPSEDALEARDALDEVVSAFHKSIYDLRGLFPNITAIHLFAAIPVGLAFRLGARINPTIYPEFVTYQYRAKGSPQYRKAIVVTEASRVASGENLTSSNEPHGNRSGIRANLERYVLSPDCDVHILSDAEYDLSTSCASSFYELMIRAYDTPPRAGEILARSGIKRSEIYFEQAMSMAWLEALRIAARSGRIRCLVENARNDSSITAHHSAIEELFGPFTREPPT
jgi:hypothetical protein